MYIFPRLSLQKKGSLGARPFDLSIGLSKGEHISGQTLDKLFLGCYILLVLFPNLCMLSGEYITPSVTQAMQTCAGVGVRLILLQGAT